MSLDNLMIDSDVEDTNPDSLGGGGFLKSTGLYPVIVDLAYLQDSAGGAVGLNLHLKLANDKSVIRQTLWLTSGTAKGRKNHYFTKDGKKRSLVGMVQGEQVSIITTGKKLGQLTTEKKTVKLWDYASSAEKPTEVDVITEMLGKPLIIGLMKVRTNKMVKDGAGNYNKLPEERLLNELDKFFYPDGLSVTEKAAGVTERTVSKNWEAKYDGEYVKDTYQPVAGSSDDSLPTIPSTASLFD